jgi:excisionase family DNA binding protein
VNTTSNNTQRQRLSDLPLALTVEEAASVLRLGRTAAYAAVRRGDIPTVRVGKSLRVPRQKLAELLGEPNENSATAANGDAENSGSGDARHEVYE